MLQIFLALLLHCWFAVAQYDSKPVDQQELDDEIASGYINPLPAKFQEEVRRQLDQFPYAITIADGQPISLKFKDNPKLLAQLVKYRSPIIKPPVTFQVHSSTCTQLKTLPPPCQVSIAFQQEVFGMWWINAPKSDLKNEPVNSSKVVRTVSIAGFTNSMERTAENDRSQSFISNTNMAQFETLNRNQYPFRLTCPNFNFLGGPTHAPNNLQILSWAHNDMTMNKELQQNINQLDQSYIDVIWKKQGPQVLQFDSWKHDKDSNKETSFPPASTMYDPMLRGLFDQETHAWNVLKNNDFCEVRWKLSRPASLAPYYKTQPQVRPLKWNQDKELFRRYHSYMLDLRTSLNFNRNFITFTYDDTDYKLDLPLALKALWSLALVNIKITIQADNSDTTTDDDFIIKSESELKSIKIKELSIQLEPAEIKR